ncbi:MAG: exodeoxyribonuclease VII large subunit [Desulfobulbus sp.]
MDDRRIFTVSELNSSIRSLLEARYPFISVAGEISNLHRPYSGHAYFTLKDSGAQIKAVLFKQQQRYLAKPIKDGDHVVCRGRISVYEPRGDYQLIADTVEYQGAGALQQAFDQLKRRLAAEGLFDEHLKRPLPQFPEHIGLITSPQGAAVHDFVRIATRRWPSIRISVYPVSVQGEQAAGEMSQALAEINGELRPDVIVLCRGGGSIEDLWCFNDEQLARAIRRSAIPVVSAVGHEIDFTIADFTADLRAPTPSAAAELLMPDRQVFRQKMEQSRNRLARSLGHHFQSANQRLQLISQRLQAMPHPLDRLMLRLDHQTTRLHNGLRQVLLNQERRLESATLKLAQHSPVHRLQLPQQHLQAAQDRLQQTMRQYMQEQEDRFARTAGILHAVSPLATLARGYAIVRTTGKQPHVLRLSTQVRQGDTIEAMLHQGRLLCRVEQVTEGQEEGD